MAYTDDAVLAKLSALNESHDSIATAAQWIMFHRRHADRTVQLWLHRLKESPSPKRLNLVYLANEVAQQSKVRKKDDFVTAFAPIIAEATAVAYKGASSDLQNKLRRVIDVWRDRGVFETPIQAAIEARIDELDKAKGSTTKTGFGGGSIFSSASTGSSVPPELTPLVAPQQKVSKAVLPLKSVVSSANMEYEKLTDPANAVPAAPVYAARLNGLLKTLASAEGAVAECVKARTELVGALEKLLASNKESLEAEQKQLQDLSSRKTGIEDKKQEVELAIMQGLADTDHEQPPPVVEAFDDDEPADDQEPERPQMEELTPPPTAENDNSEDPYGPSGSPQNGAHPISPPARPSESPAVPQQATFQPAQPSGIEMLSNLASQAQYSTVPTSANGANKRRRIDDGDDFPDLGGDDGIDPDVAEMLRKDSRS